MSVSSQTAPTANLDILRSCAVLLVLLAHFTLTLSGNGPDQRIAFGIDVYTLGRVGVLMFFVHTCLVLMLSMARSKLLGGAFFADFYIRRIFRIYPLSILLCIIIVLLHIPHSVLGAPYVWLGRRWFMSNVGLVQNLVVPQFYSLTDPLWSLPFEVQMYVVLPLIFLALALGHWAISFAILYCTGIVLAYYFPLAAYLPCFLAGVLAFNLSKTVRPIFPYWLWPMFVAVALGGYYALSPHLDMSLGKNAGFCLLLGFAIPLFADCAFHPLAVAGKLVARYSYGIYLCHYPLMWFCYRKLADKPALLQHVLFAGLLVTCSVVSFHLIEQPLINVGVRLSARLRARKPDEKQVTK